MMYNYTWCSPVGKLNNFNITQKVTSYEEKQSTFQLKYIRGEFY